VKLIAAALFWILVFLTSCGAVTKHQKLKQEDQAKWQVDVKRASVETKKAEVAKKRNRSKTREFLRPDGTPWLRETDSSQSTEQKSEVAVIQATQKQTTTAETHYQVQVESKEVRDPYRTLKLWGMMLLALLFLVLWAWWSARTWLGKTFFPWSKPR
jgi:hypothetical protein